MSRLTRPLLFASFVATLLLAGCQGCSRDDGPLRVATINVEDVRTDDVSRTDHPRLALLAAQIQAMRPDILLMNEIAYDGPGAPYYVEGDEAGQNANRFVENYLSVSQGRGLDPIRYKTFMAPSNTGWPSGFDLNRNGERVVEWFTPPSAQADGSPAAQTPEGRAYGDDSWGFGTFPGQYGMALFVREDLEILTDRVRTFQYFGWAMMPDALAPVDSATGEPFYAPEVWERFPLSSKSHWDVPVRVSDDLVLHVLASHPTPPGFDGAEQRNKRRNHDEIRFWNGYIEGATWIRDDQGGQGGLAPDASFVILGDLNADPDEGNAINNPMGTWLLSHPRVNGSFVPTADEAGVQAFPDLDPDDTARWRLRVDYVLPSIDLPVLGGQVVRPADPATPVTSDHFPVWLDLELPGSKR